MNELKAQILSNPEITDQEHRAKSTIFLASDATETSIAGVMLDDSGLVINKFARTNITYTHIFVKECLGIYCTVLWS